MTNIDKTMNENEAAVVEANIDTQVEEVEVTETDTQSPQVDVDELQKQIDTLKAQKEHWKGKATAEPKEPEPVKEEKKVDLSHTDMLTLAKSDIQAEDMDIVEDYLAKGMSVQDMMKNEDFSAIVDRRSESRKAAAAANVGTAKGSGAETSGEGLLNEAKAGKLPDPDKLAAMWDAESKK